MNEKKYILLDFDGTMVDTVDLAINIYNRIAPDYNCRGARQEDIKKYGLNKPQEFFKRYGVTKFKLFLIVLRIRKELKKQIAVIRPVKNIEYSLFDFKKAGYNLGIVTTNSRDNVRKFLENNNLSGIIDFIYTSNKLYGKDRVIRRILARYDIAKGNVLYVGDETRDIEASEKAGIPVVAVCWGLTPREIIEMKKPDQIADNPEELFMCSQRILNR